MIKLQVFFRVSLFALIFLSEHQLQALSCTRIMLERDTGRPRGFGFVTFSDHRAMDDAIREMHQRELGDRVITVNKAQPKMGGGDDSGYGYGGSYSSGGRGSSYGGGDRSVSRSDCFKCGRPGHWARECPSAGGGDSRFPSRSRFNGGGGRGDRFGGDRYGDRYIDDRYDSGRYGDRDRVDSRDSSRYGGARDRYASDRYPAAGADRYGGSDRFPSNGYGKERGYDRDAAAPPRAIGSDRYGGGGPARYDGGSYRERPTPYDRPSRVPRQSSYEDRY